MPIVFLPTRIDKEDGGTVSVQHGDCAGIFTVPALQNLVELPYPV